MRLAADLTSAWRNVRRGGWPSLMVVLILAVAMGAVTSVFSIVHAVLLRPLPVADPDRVVILWGRGDPRSQPIVEVSQLDLRAWLARQQTFTTIALFGSVNWGELDVTGPGAPFRAVKNAASAGFFDVLGARPLIGRTFRPEDDVRGARPTVVLSADVWRQQFSSDPAIVGRLLTVGTGSRARAVEVIGVMPPDFRFPAGAQVWVALGPTIAADADAQGWHTEAVRAMYAVGRLAPGSTAEQAVAELSAITRNEELKKGLTGTAMAVVATPLLTHVLGPARPALAAIAGASGALLLIACANAAALMLVQGAGRRRELATRLALGAARHQIVRQLFCESLVLALAAGMLGVSLAYASFGAVVSLAPLDVPRLDEASIDIEALMFALILCFATAIVVGLFPAWRHSGDAPLACLHDRSRSATATSSTARLRKLLVAGQLAAVVLLLTASALFVRSFMALLHLDLGFDPRGVLTFNLGFADDAFDTKEKQWALADAVLDSTRQLPGVMAAGAVYQRPFANGAIGMDTSIIVEGQPLNAESASRNPILNWEAATPGYFEAMDIHLLQGRFFDDRDTSTSLPVVIIGQSLASRLWPHQSPVGRRVLTYGMKEKDGQPGWQTIVGVVEDARYREVGAARFDVYVPYRQSPNPVHHFMVRMSGDPLASVAALKTAVSARAPGARLDGMSTMDAIVGRAFAPWRFSSVVVTAFAVMAMTFAAVGIATLVAFAVTQRTREIGVRVALGANPLAVVVLVAREGAWAAVIGLGLGMLAAWMLRRTVQSMLFGVSVDDMATFGGVALLLGAVSVMAAYLPARRAAQLDPVAALRAE